MTALKNHGKLLVAAVPVVLVVVGLTGLLTAGNGAASKDRAETATSESPGKASTQAGNALGSHRTAQAATPSSANRNAGASGAFSRQAVLKIYRCPPGSAETTAAQLHQHFGGDPRVRVVPDARTSQVLLMAPPEVQAQVAKHLPEDRSSPRVNRPAESAPALSMPSGTPTPSAAAPTQEIQLWQTSGQQFEAALVRMLADRLAPVTSPQPGTSAYQLAMGNGQAVGLSIDRRQNRVRMSGNPVALGSGVQLVHVLDSPGDSAERSTRLLSLNPAQSPQVRQVVDALRSGQSSQGGPGSGNRPRRPNPFRLAMADQPSAPAGPGVAGGPAAANGQPPASPEAAAALAPGSEFAAGLQEEGGLIGPVQVEPIPGTDILVIRGHERDVQKVMDMIEQIERISEEEKPIVLVHHLLHVDCRSLVVLLNELYEEVFAARQGDVSITSLVRPNAVLLVGRQESVDTVLDLIKRLDRPVPPTAQFKVFRLKSTAAEEAQTTIEAVFEEEADADEAGLGPRVQVIADFRTNSLIVRANPRDMAHVAAIIEQMDAGPNETVNQVKIFKLKNSLAEDLAGVLQDALTGPMYGQRMGQRAIIQRAIGAGEAFERKSIRLQFVTTGDDGQHSLLNSGILTDAQVTADTRANALVVTASPESMPLIGALIEELDALPKVEAEVKVFTIVHGDAQSLVNTLEDLLGAQAQPADLAVRTGAAGEDSSLVSMRFAVETRTNSIIATGSAGDLELVTAMIIALDENEELWLPRQRKTHVIRLKNASALNVADAVNEFVANVLEAEQPVQGLLSATEQMDRQVIVVPEEVTNSLIISSTDWFFDRIVDLVEKLDARDPMVVIQVLIAAVRLNDTDEFGVELGLQDSILFDRSVAGVPGFLFNNADLGNNTGAPGSNIVGTQGLGHFDLGRVNDELGYGGLVISASSEAVSVLIRALKENRRVDILGRPQIMTVDKVAARILVGQTVRIPSGTSTTQFGGVNLTTEQRDVGLELQVTPRVSSDGAVFMEIVTQRSQLGPEEEGTVIAISETGEAFRSPRIDIAQAETSVTAMSGQTIVLGGMITTDRSQVNRKVPWLGDVPVLGHLFRYDAFEEEKTELLIIMTPHIVDSLEEAELIKQVEAARINWCLNDVLEVHGDIYDRDGQMPVIYPDLDPGAPAFPMAPLPDDLEGVRAPAKGSPFMTEPLRSQPDEEQTIPDLSVPPPDQASVPLPVPASGPVPFDGVHYSLSGPFPPFGAGMHPPGSGSPSGVEQATYEMRLPPPGGANFNR